MLLRYNLSIFHKMELYGVEHGSGFTLFGEVVIENEVRPAIELLMDLEKLPIGSRVGIETTPEIQAGGDSKIIQFTDESIGYWRPIISLCERRGLEVAYLDDFELFKKYGAFLAARNALAKSYEDSKNTLDDHTACHTKSLIYCFDTMASYIFEVEREDEIFRKMESQKPDVAIIGGAHADYLMLDPTASNSPVNRKTYKQAINEHIPLFSLETEDSVIRVLQSVVRGKPDLSFIQSRDYIKRRYNAITQGKIITDNGSWEPNWVGTWDFDCPMQGFFEMVLEETGHANRIWGDMEDINGLGYFDGDLKDDSISIIKEYEPGYIVGPFAAIGEIMFEGKRREDEYVGTYKTQEGTSGEFLLTKNVKNMYEPISQEELLAIAQDIIGGNSGEGN